MSGIAAVTFRKGPLVDAHTFTGNPYVGHVLIPAIAQTIALLEGIGLELDACRRLATQAVKRPLDQRPAAWHPEGVHRQVGADHACSADRDHAGVGHDERNGFTPMARRGHTGAGYVPGGLDACAAAGRRGSATGRIEGSCSHARTLWVSASGGLN